MAGKGMAGPRDPIWPEIVEGPAEMCACKSQGAPQSSWRGADREGLRATPGRDRREMRLVKGQRIPKAHLSGLMTQPQRGDWLRARLSLRYGNERECGRRLGCAFHPARHSHALPCLPVFFSQISPAPKVTEMKKVIIQR